MSRAEKICKCGHDDAAHSGFDGGCMGMREGGTAIISNKVLQCHCKKFEPKPS